MDGSLAGHKIVQKFNPICNTTNNRTEVPQVSLMHNHLRINEAFVCAMRIGNFLLGSEILGAEGEKKKLSKQPFATPQGPQVRKLSDFVYRRTPLCVFSHTSCDSVP